MSNIESISVTYAVAILRHELLLHGEVYHGFKASLITIAINIVIFVTMGAFLMVDTKKSNPFFTAFLILLELGCILNTYLIVTAY